MAACRNVTELSSIKLIHGSISLPESSKIKKIKTIVEEVVDGRVVSSEVKEVEEKM